MSMQPTHHGYAVNVKDNDLFTLERGTLSDEDVQALYDQRAEDFWELVQDIGREYGFTAVYSEGRSSGWAQPSPQPSDEMYEEELAEWLEQRFRPFERDTLALMADCKEEFAADLADAVKRAAAEPSERAHWEARGVETR
jgi:hypothetical protein